MNPKTRTQGLLLIAAVTIAAFGLGMAASPAAATGASECLNAAVYWWEQAAETGDGLGGQRDQYMERGASYERLYELGADCTGWPTT